MSLDGIRSSVGVALDGAGNDVKRDDSTAETPAAREFDFAGAAYASVHLPHALLGGTATSRPTIATVTRDLADFESKMHRLQTDLGSPGMRAWLGKHVEATKTGLSIGVKLAAIALTIAVFKDKGVALLGSVDGVLKLVTGGEKISALVGDCKTFAHQLAEEHVAAKAAHPDVVRIEHDLAEMMSAGAKLAVDMRKLGGV